MPTSGRSAPALPQPAAARESATRPPAPPRPTLRAQGDDPPPDPRPAPLVMPSPEALGVRGAPPAGGDADWAAVHRRLQELGAVCFQLERLEQGGCRCVCLLPTADPNRRHRIESLASDESAAVRGALHLAEQWSGQRR